MPNTITSQTIVNGSRNLVIQYNIVADGTGDFTNFPLFDLNDYIASDYPVPNLFAVRTVSGQSATGSTFQLKFGSESGNHDQFFASTVNESPQLGWEGGMPNLVQDADNTIRLSTSDFDESGLTMTVALEIKKKHRSETE